MYLACSLQEAGPFDEPARNFPATFFAWRQTAALRQAIGRVKNCAMGPRNGALSQQGAAPAKRVLHPDYAAGA
ncbi:hypothetical protein AWC35_06835 [Gibbsiella quercinecans]|uniref:Uncharacterized protein n=1 Tax=Gibbsiella quercinecans TaxID=929813 RepID=A0A250AZ27_9GAMM|nr:hypothetical protein AWC35_06835 [Gibbsiella quercinecans]RLM03659.1 hypothetical protein BIY30_21995 [Gibbsiella quercinecans]RLM07745.1 hypothetical protein BIY31_12985 [Gibbsiella quercinecans]